MNKGDLMIASLSKTLAQYIYNENSGRNYSLAIYEYGFELLLSTLFNTIFILLIGYVLNIFIEVLIYMLAFGSLRVLAGGYHAGSHLSCFVKYTSVAVVFIFLIENFQISYLEQTLLIGYLSLVSIFIVFKYAPVDSTNKPMSHNKKGVYKTRSRIFITIFSISIVLITSITPCNNYYITIVTGAVFIESITLIPIFKKGGITDEKDD